MVPDPEAIGARKAGGVLVNPGMIVRTSLVLRSKLNPGCTGTLTFQMWRSSSACTRPAYFDPNRLSSVIRMAPISRASANAMTFLRSRRSFLGA